MAEMAAKAQEISMEAGSKMSGAMRDVISAAAGLSSFAIESARDLINYMVRRGQMSQEEANKLMREVEEAHASRPKVEPTRKAEPAKVKAEPAEKAHHAEDIAAAHEKTAVKHAPPAKKPEAHHAPPPPAKKAPVKAAAKPAAKAKAPAKPAPKVAAKKIAKKR